VLPDIAPVMAHSVFSEFMFAMISENSVKTGTPLSARMKSAWLLPDTRTRRPARSESRVTARLQKITWAG